MLRYTIFWRTTNPYFSLISCKLYFVVSQTILFKSMVNVYVDIHVYVLYCVVLN